MHLKGWGGKCHDPELIEMTDEMKAALLDMHNKFRNQQANGDTPNYEPATRMATMVSGFSYKFRQILKIYHFFMMRTQIRCIH